MSRHAAKSLFLLSTLLFASAEAANAYDLVVYDATSGGVLAATAAARHGMKTVLLCASWPACFKEGGLRVGGMSSGGLGQTDFGPHPEVIGGFAREFYERNRAKYPKGASSSMVASDPCRIPSSTCNVTYNLEPHVAEGVFRDMLNESGVQLVFSAQVESVAKEGTTIKSLTLTDSTVYTAKVCIASFVFMHF
jgi:2-polyprenyl-6-methoxyphenol hydroxylase-like FAD-dependent oxidoreductase